MEKKGGNNQPKFLRQIEIIGTHWEKKKSFYRKRYKIHFTCEAQDTQVEKNNFEAA